MIRKSYVAGMGTLFLTVLIGGQTAMGSYEIPSYKVLGKSKSIEVREYAPVIQAEVT